MTDSAPPRFYYSSVQAPTVVVSVEIGSLESPNVLNAVIARDQSIELCQIGHDGLRQICTAKIFGSIKLCKLIKLPKENLHSIFFLTYKNEVGLLEYDPDSNSLKTRVYGNVNDSVYSECQVKPLIAVEPFGRCIALRIYDGILKIIHFDEKTYSSTKKCAGQPSKIKAITCMFRDSDVISFDFLKTGDDSGSLETPALVCLYQDADGDLNISTYQVFIKDECCQKKKWVKTKIDNEAKLVVASKDIKYQFLVIGSNVISYFNISTLESRPETSDELHEEPDHQHTALHEIEQVCQVDQARYIVSAADGSLFLLALLTSDGKLWKNTQFDTNSISTTNTFVSPSSIQSEFLGHSNRPSALAYLDNSVLFVGSETGDSQILKILESPETIENMDTNEVEIFAKPVSYLKEIEKISNIGPIQDMIVTSEENCNSQCQLLTCSGDVNSGTLRILRSGIGIQEKAFLPIPGVQSIWAFNHPDIKESFTSDMEEGDISVKNSHEGIHNSVLLTIENSTKSFAISGESVEEISFPGLVSDKATLGFYQLEADQFLQICPHHINLFNRNGSLDLLSFSDEETCINFTEYLNSKIFTAAGKTLSLYKIVKNKVEHSGELNFENDIASLKGCESLSMIAVGFWSGDVNIFDIEGKLIKVIKTECSSIPQSLMFEKFEKDWYLLASMSDGMLISSRIDGNDFVDISKSILGTGPMTLTNCQAIDEKQNVVEFLFAYGDNPVTISISNGKLRLTSVNIKSIAYCCRFDTNYFQSSVCICTPDGILIGSIDSEQKIHIRTRDLKESPNKIAYYSGVEFQNKEKIRNLDNSCFIVSCYHYSHPEFRKSKIESENTLKAEQFKLEDSSQGYQEVVDNGADNEQYSILFLDEQTFNVIHRYELVENEMVTALEVMELSDKNGENFKEYIIVATALYNVDETEPLLGRIHVLEYTNNKINVITIKIAEGK